MRLTADDVFWAYRRILGRDPENNDVILHWTQRDADWRELVIALLASPEFANARLDMTGRLAAGSPTPLNYVTIDGFTYSETPEARDAALQVARMLRPYRALGHRKIRIGNEFDGGYVMLDDLTGIQAAYSLGIKDDVTWDLEITRRGIPVYQYDHTIDALPVENALFHWRKIGIGSSEGNAALRPLQVLMSEDLPDDKGPLILKCDIEGAEWEMFSAMSEGQLNRFKQIMVEVHGLGHLYDKENADLVIKGLKALTKNHVVVNVHANNNSAYCIVGGVPLPATLELLLVARDCYQIVETDETFPSDLDRPCYPSRIDYSLGAFKF